MLRSQLIELLSNKIAALQLPHPTRVAIDGIDAAGKTTLADELVEPLRSKDREVIRASIDSFHNPRTIRHRRGSDSPDGYYEDSFDYQAFRDRLLEPLGPGGSLKYQTAAFDHLTDTPAVPPTLTAAPNSILLVDGIFLMRPELRSFWDFKIFIHVTFEIAVARACQRDETLLGSVEKARERYHHRYVPGQKIYLEQCHPEKHADLVIDNNNPDNPLIEG